MKVSLLLTLVTTLNVSAVLYSQDSKLNLTVKDKSLIDVIRVIEQQSNYRFFFSDNYQDLSNLVSVNVKDGNIDKVLSDLFENKAITYKVLDNNVIVITPSESIVQQQTITGTVNDATTGEALPGVNIVVEGTTIGVITDIDGKYSITVENANATLAFSFVGYLTQKIAVQGNSVINVRLEADVKKLDEVVVVGYGTQKKSDITGSITSVDVAKIRDVPSANISKALQGKTAGVEIQNLGSKPGGNTQIRIRGSRSLSADNNPLIVVDGIPFNGTLNDIASDDIASLEVLKDASATVIYGSRGSNGVIIITTKRGEVGKLRVTYNGYRGISNVSREYDTFSAEEFVKMRSVAGYEAYLPVENESLLLGRETDWQDVLYQTGITDNHEIGISGGSEMAQYSFSAGYFNETYVVPFIGFKRYTMRMSVDQKLGKRFKVGLSSLNAYSITDGQSVSVMWPAVSLSPLSTPYNNDGTMRDQPVYPTDDTYNPVSLADDERWKEQNRRISSFNTFYAEVQLFEGLRLKVNAGVDFSQDKYNNFYGSNTPMRNTLANQSQVKNEDRLSWTIENMLIYEKTIANNHRITFTGMQSSQKAANTVSRFDGMTTPADYLQYNNFSLAETVTVPSNASGANNNNNTEWSLLSYMGRLNYAFKDRYLVTLTARSDGSSRLAPGRKWHSYPAVALGWNISKESFLSNSEIVSNLKVRFGYGQTSNTSVSPYSTLGGLTIDKYSFGETGVNGFYVTTLPNPDLGWEFTKQTNFGLDFGFLNGRITGSVDYYNQQTNDLLLSKKLPASLGVSGGFLQNIGKTENKGLEIVLSGDVIASSKQGGFKWELSGNIFFNREKILELQDPTIKKDVGNGWFVGSPASAIYDYKKVGIWQLGEETQAAVYGAKPGDIKLADLNGDSKITEDDRKLLGSSEPDLVGGFTSTWEFKGFDLSVVGYFKSGGKIVSTLHMPNNYINRLDGRRNGLKVDYWSPTNPTNDMPKPDAAFVPARTNVLGYFDGSFLKIRSINLGYNINKNWIKFLGAGSSMRVYATVTDPFIFFSPYLDKGGVDPEPTGQAQYDNSALGMVGRTLVVSLSTPPTTKIIFGVNVKF